MLKITPSVIDQVRKELETSFDKIEKKFGIKLDTGSARYNASEFHLKITGIVITKENAGLSAEEVSLKKDLELYGEHIFSMGAKLLPEDYGKTFEASNRKWTFIGINPKKHKYPIAAKNSDGKIYYFTEHYALKIRPLKPIVIKEKPSNPGVKMSDIINPLLIKGVEAEVIADKVIEQFPEKLSERAKLIQQIKGPRTLNLIKAGKLRK